MRTFRGKERSDVVLLCSTNVEGRLRSSTGWGKHEVSTEGRRDRRASLGVTWGGVRSHVAVEAPETRAHTIGRRSEETDHKPPHKPAEALVSRPSGGSDYSFTFH